MCRSRPGSQQEAPHTKWEERQQKGAYREHYRARYSKSSSRTPEPARFRKENETHQWEKQWEAFDTQTGQIKLKNVPFPPRQALMRARTDKAEYKKLVLRFHPDKWLQRYKHRINKTEETRMMEQVTQTFRMINDIRDRGHCGFTSVQVG